MQKLFTPIAVSAGVLALVGALFAAPQMFGAGEPQQPAVEFVQPAAQVEPVATPTPTPTPAKAVTVKPKPVKKKAAPVQEKVTVSEPQQPQSEPEPTPEVTATPGAPIPQGGGGPGYVCNADGCVYFDTDN